MKKLAIIGTTGLPAKYGGFETLCNYLTEHLNKKFDITVYCSSKYFAASGLRKSHHNNSKLVYLPLNANGYQSIIYDIISIFHALFYADALLVLGVSGAVMLPFVRLFSTKPIIVNIDGLEWKRSKWNSFTKKYLRYSEKLAVKYADTVIADNKAIVEYVKETYGRDAALIEYGADHVRKCQVNDIAIATYPFIVNPYAFKVCRIEPENNIEMVLEAFSRMPHKTLVMVGLWNHGDFGVQLRKKYEQFSNLYLLDPIYNTEELDVIRSNASVYIHGHSAGGTNPSLVEAMHLALPVFSFDVEYNRKTTCDKAFYFNNAEELIGLIEGKHKAELLRCSEMMQAIASEKYTWTRIAGCYFDEINGLLETPEALLVDQLRLRKPQTIKIYTGRKKEADASQ